MLRVLILLAAFVLAVQALAIPYSNTTTLTQNITATDNQSLYTRDDQWGRPGKFPYRRFPPCFVDCFDSEGIDSKTWPAIGDIRDLTTDEFCRTQQTWVMGWVIDHLQFCVRGACADCRRPCNQQARDTWTDICGKPPPM
ncbi:hypothetical protein BJ166DRAFT_491257 [Pestalotiopsis sp. NC0098]|nr:hypothetical protein BJ166DRAFT_491257 [Pestalotiopsis sp. NC0098]